MDRVVLGLGSNISRPNGDRMSYLRDTIQILKSPLTSPWIKVLAVSPLYESDALLPDGAPLDWNQPYLNLCLLCETELRPLDLLKAVKEVESKMGRKGRSRWAPREIDIDILAFDSESPRIFETEELKIPHIGLLERPFALFPLADLLPHWRLPPPGSVHRGKEDSCTAGPYPSLKEGASMTASAFVTQWKKNLAGQIPFRTRRSGLFLTELVGIVNVTPDSFSDGGKFLEPREALRQAKQLLADGARILDIGAESTRPGAAPLSAEEEWSRLAPILTELSPFTLAGPQSFTLSVDTRHPETALRCIQAGVHWINDVTGLSESRNAQSCSGLRCSLGDDA